MNWSANGRSRLYSIRRSTARCLERVDHQFHPAAEAALHQDRVTRRDGVARRSAPARPNPAHARHGVGRARRRTARASADRRRTARSAAATTSSASAAVFGGTCLAEFQHVAKHRNAALRRLQTQHRQRRAHRGGIAIVAFVQQQSRAAGHVRSAAARPDRRAARRFQRTRARSYISARAPDEMHGRASAASAFIAIWRPGAFSRNRTGGRALPRRPRCRPHRV